MKKTYKSRNTTPHFSIGNKRITFLPMSNGGSYYETEDEKEMEHIENHPWFGTLFTLSKVVNDELPKTKTKTEDDAPKVGPKAVDDVPIVILANTDEAQNEPKDEAKVMYFDTLADAKNYLASEFDVVRSNIKNTATAISIGKSHGVDIRIGKEKTE